MENILNEFLTSKDRVLNLLNFLPYPLIIAKEIDEKMIHVFANAQFLVEIGYTDEAIPTIEHWFSLAYPDEAYRQEIIQQWTQQMNIAKANQIDSAVVQAKIRLKNGQDCWYKVKATIWKDYHAVAFINIDQLVRQNETLIIQNTNKDKILSLISHDIRTPIIQIIALLDLFKDETLEASEFLSMSDLVCAKVNEILSFVDNILHWAKNNFQQFNITKSNFAIGVQIDEIVALYETEIAHKQITIIKDLSVLEVISTDKEIFSVVLRNILTNAVKFTPKYGSITIRASEEGAYWCIEVADTGVGIDTTSLKNINNDIHHTTKGTNKEQGFGVGLLLCRDLLTKIGGYLSIHSEIANGTTVSICLPK